jgi:Na+-translocating ferredoxin:NAD+ oxidoreductase RnfC subunit
MNTSGTNSLIKIWEIPGGIHPPENKAQSMQLPLGKLPIPAQLPTYWGTGKSYSASGR